jgi:hypothetical protein
MSRLHRETNPTPGFSPGVLPQHEKTDGTFVVTGENNPLPTIIYGPDGQPLFTAEKPAHVQLTGRKVEEVILYPRAIRTSNTARAVIVPSGAIGLIVTVMVYGVTGTFGSNQGLHLSVGQIDNMSTLGAYRLVTNRVTSPHRLHGYIYPGLDLSNAQNIANAQFVGVSMIPFARVGIGMDISGTFDTDQGFDCELRYYWFY